VVVGTERVLEVSSAAEDLTAEVFETMEFQVVEVALALSV